MKKAIIGLVLTLVVAAVGGFVAWTASPELPDETHTTERARAAASGLEESHVYVDPSAQGAFTGNQLTRIGEAAAASDPQVYVVVWPESSEAGYRLASDVLRQIGRRLDRPGVYLQISPNGATNSVDVGIDAESFSVSDSPDEKWSGDRETKRLLGEIAENDGRSYELGEPQSGYWGGTGSVIGAGVLIGTLGGGILGTAGLITWFVLRRRRAAA